MLPPPPGGYGYEREPGHLKPPGILKPVKNPISQPLSDD